MKKVTVKKTKKAKEMIIDAMIGLVLVFGAYFITDLIGSNV